MFQRTPHNCGVFLFRVPHALRCSFSENESRRNSPRRPLFFVLPSSWLSPHRHYRSGFFFPFLTHSAAHFAETNPVVILRVCRRFFALLCSRFSPLPTLPRRFLFPVPHALRCSFSGNESRRNFPRMPLFFRAAAIGFPPRHAAYAAAFSFFTSPKRSRDSVDIAALRRYNKTNDISFH